MASDPLASLAIAALGGAAALIGQGALKFLDHKRETRAASKAEQTKVAQELLMRIERFCREFSAWRKPGMKGVLTDDPVSGIREDAAVLAVALTDPKAREHLNSIDLAMWLLMSHEAARHLEVYFSPNPFPIKMAARAVLGAIQRGEQVPAELPMLEELLITARKVEDLLEREAREAQAVFDARP